MFERISVRVIAGALLWSTAMSFLAVIYHGRVFGPAPQVATLEHTIPLIRCLVAGSFFGAIFGGLLNVPRHPFFGNLGASLATLFAAELSPALAQQRLVPSWPGWANGLAIAFAVIAAVGALSQLAGQTIRRKPPRAGEA